MTARLLILAATLALLGSCASVGKPSEEPGGGKQTLLELRAVVTGVDQRRRLVALESDDGGILVLPVAEDFPDLDKLCSGDAVIISYTEEVSREVEPMDVGAAGATGRETESAIKITARITASIRRAVASR